MSAAPLHSVVSPSAGSMSMSSSILNRNGSHRQHSPARSVALEYLQQSTLGGGGGGDIAANANSPRHQHHRQLNNSTINTIHHSNAVANANGRSSPPYSSSVPATSASSSPTGGIRLHTTSQWMATYHQGSPQAPMLMGRKDSSSGANGGGDPSSADHTTVTARRPFDVDAFIATDLRALGVAPNTRKSAMVNSYQRPNQQEQQQQHEASSQQKPTAQSPQPTTSASSPHSSPRTAPLVVISTPSPPTSGPTSPTRRPPAPLSPTRGGPPPLSSPNRRQRRQNRSSQIFSLGGLAADDDGDAEASDGGAPHPDEEEEESPTRQRRRARYAREEAIVHYPQQHYAAVLRQQRGEGGSTIVGGGTASILLGASTAAAALTTNNTIGGSERPPPVTMAMTMPSSGSAPLSGSYDANSITVGYAKRSLASAAGNAAMGLGLLSPAWRGLPRELGVPAEDPHIERGVGASTSTSTAAQQKRDVVVGHNSTTSSSSPPRRAQTADSPSHHTHHGAATSPMRSGRLTTAGATETRRAPMSTTATTTVAFRTLPSAPRLFGGAVVAGGSGGASSTTDFYRRAGLAGGGANKKKNTINNGSHDDAAAHLSQSARGLTVEERGGRFSFSSSNANANALVIPRPQTVSEAAASAFALGGGGGRGAARASRISATTPRPTRKQPQLTAIVPVNHRNFLQHSVLGGEGDDASDANASGLGPRSQPQQQQQQHSHTLQAKLNASRFSRRAVPSTRTLVRDGINLDAELHPMLVTVPVVVPAPRATAANNTVGGGGGTAVARRPSFSTVNRTTLVTDKALIGHLVAALLDPRHKQLSEAEWRDTVLEGLATHNEAVRQALMLMAQQGGGGGGGSSSSTSSALLASFLRGNGPSSSVSASASMPSGGAFTGDMLYAMIPSPSGSETSDEEDEEEDDYDYDYDSSSNGASRRDNSHASGGGDSVLRPPSSTTFFLTAANGNPPAENRRKSTANSNATLCTSAGQQPAAATEKKKDYYTHHRTQRRREREERRKQRAAAAAAASSAGKGATDTLLQITAAAAAAQLPSNSTNNTYSYSSSSAHHQHQRRKKRKSSLNPLRHPLRDAEGHYIDEDGVRLPAAEVFALRAARLRRYLAHQLRRKDELLAKLTRPLADHVRSRADAEESTLKGTIAKLLSTFSEALVSDESTSDEEGNCGEGGGGGGGEGSNSPMRYQDTDEYHVAGSFGLKRTSLATSTTSSSHKTPRRRGQQQQQSMSSTPPNTHNNTANKNVKDEDSGGGALHDVPSTGKHKPHKKQRLSSQARAFLNLGPRRNQITSDTASSNYEEIQKILSQKDFDFKHFQRLRSALSPEERAERERNFGDLSDIFGGGGATDGRAQHGEGSRRQRRRQHRRNSSSSTESSEYSHSSDYSDTDEDYYYDSTSDDGDGGGDGSSGDEEAAERRRRRRRRVAGSDGSDEDTDDDIDNDDVDIAELVEKRKHRREEKLRQKQERREQRRQARRAKRERRRERTRLRRLREAEGLYGDDDDDELSGSGSFGRMQGFTLNTGLSPEMLAAQKRRRRLSRRKSWKLIAGGSLGANVDGERTEAVRLGRGEGSDVGDDDYHDADGSDDGADGLRSSPSGSGGGGGGGHYYDVEYTSRAAVSRAMTSVEDVKFAARLKMLAEKEKVAEEAARLAALAAGGGLGVGIGRSRLGGGRASQTPLSFGLPTSHRPSDGQHYQQHNGGGRVGHRSASQRALFGFDIATDVRLEVVEVFDGIFGYGDDEFELISEDGDYYHRAQQHDVHDSFGSNPSTSRASSGAAVMRTNSNVHSLAGTAHDASAAASNNALYAKGASPTAAASAATAAALDVRAGLDYYGIHLHNTSAEEVGMVLDLEHLKGVYEITALCNGAGYVDKEAHPLRIQVKAPAGARLEIARVRQNGGDDEDGDEDEDAPEEEDSSNSAAGGRRGTAKKGTAAASAGKKGAPQRKGSLSKNSRSRKKGSSAPRNGAPSSSSTTSYSTPQSRRQSMQLFSQLKGTITLGGITSAITVKGLVVPSSSTSNAPPPPAALLVGSQYGSFSRGGVGAAKGGGGGGASSALHSPFSSTSSIPALNRTSNGASKATGAPSSPTLGTTIGTSNTPSRIGGGGGSAAASPQNPFGATLPSRPISPTTAGASSHHHQAIGGVLHRPLSGSVKSLLAGSVDGTNGAATITMVGAIGRGGGAGAKKSGMGGDMPPPSPRRATKVPKPPARLLAAAASRKQSAAAAVSPPRRGSRSKGGSSSPAATTPRKRSTAVVAVSATPSAPGSGNKGERRGGSSGSGVVGATRRSTAVSIDAALVGGGGGGGDQPSTRAPSVAEASKATAEGGDGCDPPPADDATAVDGAIGGSAVPADDLTANDAKQKKNSRSDSVPTNSSSSSSSSYDSADFDDDPYSARRRREPVLPLDPSYGLMHPHGDGDDAYGGDMLLHSQSMPWLAGGRHFYTTYSTHQEWPIGDGWTYHRVGSHTHHHRHRRSRSRSSPSYPSQSRSGGRGGHLSSGSFSSSSPIRNSGGSPGGRRHTMHHHHATTATSSSPPGGDGADGSSIRQNSLSTSNNNNNNSALRSSPLRYSIGGAGAGAAYNGNGGEGLGIGYDASAADAFGAKTAGGAWSSAPAIAGGRGTNDPSSSSYHYQNAHGSSDVGGLNGGPKGGAFGTAVGGNTNRGSIYAGGPRGGDEPNRGDVDAPSWVTKGAGWGDRDGKRSPSGRGGGGGGGARGSFEEADRWGGGGKARSWDMPTNSPRKSNAADGEGHGHGDDDVGDTTPTFRRGGGGGRKAKSKQAARPPTNPMYVLTTTDADDGAAAAAAGRGGKGKLPLDLSAQGVGAGMAPPTPAANKVASSTARRLSSTAGKPLTVPPSADGGSGVIVGPTPPAPPALPLVAGSRRLPTAAGSGSGSSKAEAVGLMPIISSARKNPFDRRRSSNGGAAAEGPNNGDDGDDVSAAATDRLPAAADGRRASNAGGGNGVGTATSTTTSASVMDPAVRDAVMLAYHRFQAEQNMPPQEGDEEGLDGRGSADEATATASSAGGKLPLFTRDAKGRVHVTPSSLRHAIAPSVAANVVRGRVMASIGSSASKSSGSGGARGHIGAVEGSSAISNIGHTLRSGALLGYSSSSSPSGDVLSGDGTAASAAAASGFTAPPPPSTVFSTRRDRRSIVGDYSRFSRHAPLREQKNALMYALLGAATAVTEEKRRRHSRRSSVVSSGSAADDDGMGNATKPSAATTGKRRSSSISRRLSSSAAAATDAKASPSHSTSLLDKLTDLLVLGANPSSVDALLGVLMNGNAEGTVEDSTAGTDTDGGKGGGLLPKVAHPPSAASAARLQHFTQSLVDAVVEYNGAEDEDEVINTAADYGAIAPPSSEAPSSSSSSSLAQQCKLLIRRNPRVYDEVINDVADLLYSRLADMGVGGDEEDEDGAEGADDHQLSTANAAAAAPPAAAPHHHQQAHRVIVLASAQPHKFIPTLPTIQRRHNQQSVVDVGGGGGMSLPPPASSVRHKSDTNPAKSCAANDTVRSVKGDYTSIFEVLMAELDNAGGEVSPSREVKRYVEDRREVDRRRRRRRRELQLAKGKGGGGGDVSIADTVVADGDDEHLRRDSDDEFGYDEESEETKAQRLAAKRFLAEEQKLRKVASDWAARVINRRNNDATFAAQLRDTRSIMYGVVKAVSTQLRVRRQINLEKLINVMHRKLGDRGWYPHYTDDNVYTVLGAGDSDDDDDGDADAEGAAAADNGRSASSPSDPLSVKAAKSLQRPPPAKRRAYYKGCGYGYGQAPPPSSNADGGGGYSDYDGDEDGYSGGCSPRRGSRRRGASPPRAPPQYIRPSGRIQFNFATGPVAKQGRLKGPSAHNWGGGAVTDKGLAVGGSSGARSSPAAVAVDAAALAEGGGSLRTPAPPPPGRAALSTANVHPPSSLAARLAAGGGEGAEGAKAFKYTYSLFEIDV